MINSVITNIICPDCGKPFVFETKTGSTVCRYSNLRIGRILDFIILEIYSTGKETEVINFDPKNDEINLIIHNENYMSKQTYPIKIDKSSVQSIINNLYHIFLNKHLL